MGRRLPRRVWHTVAALVPLPLIGLGYVAAVPGNPVAFQIELFLSGHGAEYAQTRAAGVSNPPARLPREAAQLFRTGGKGPRADQYLAANTVTSAGKQLIAASLMGDPSLTGENGEAIQPRAEVRAGDSHSTRLDQVEAQHRPDERGLEDAGICVAPDEPIRQDSRGRVHGPARRDPEPAETRSTGRVLDGREQAAFEDPGLAGRHQPDQSAGR